MSGDFLREVLDGRRDELREGIALAEAEMRELRASIAELEDLVRRARAALGDLDPTSGAGAGGRQMTLHDAMVKVLRDRGNPGVSPADIANAVNAEKLYVKRDGEGLQGAGQVHARVSNYPDRFYKKEGLIFLTADWASSDPE